MVFASRDNTRPALKYLKIVEEKAIATNGHILIATDVVKDDTEVPAEILLKSYEGKAGILTIGLNPTYGKQVFEFLEKFVYSKSPNKTDYPKCVKLTFYSSTDAIKIEAKNLDTDQNLTALLMPCRLEP